MFDISGLTGSFKGMSEERRRVLADFFKARNAYMEKATELNDRRISALLDPTPEREQAVKDFASKVVAPLRTQAAVQAVAILKDAVNVEKLQELLPMLALAVLQCVDIQSAMVAIGLEPDQLEEFAQLAQGFLKRGMD